MVGVSALRFLRDSSWRRPNMNIVIAGSPLRVFRLTDAGARVIADAETHDVSPTTVQQELLDRFVDAGALHPLPTAGPYTAADVTIVVPAFNRLPAWTAQRTIIVDDGSIPALAAAHLRHEINRGPAAARNTGLAQVTTPLVAFIDTDVSFPHATWLERLLAHFVDERVALVAPRAVGAPGTSWLAGYEQRHSPLDLGGEPGRIAAGTRVSYVPAAAIVCRVEAVRAIGGFDDALRTGEDVDLVWRLHAAGHRCRYEPSSVVWHQSRNSVVALARQRFGFGRSAGPLAVRHPGALRPVRLNRWSALVWVLAVLRRPLLAGGVLVGAAVALARKLRDVTPFESMRLAGVGTFAAGRQLADAVTRVWWPLAVLLAAIRRGSRLPLAVALIAPVAVGSVRERSAQPLVDAPLQLLDRMAYGAGVWAGAVAVGDLTALLPGILAHSTQTESGTNPQAIS
jgi:mycofactocin system glycosyltransferase